MLRNYDEKIKKLLSSKESNSDTDWEKIYDEHKFMLKTIRHERLIHLLVTIFVGLVMSISFFTTIMSEKSFLLLLDIPLLMLFMGYLFHYRFLENTTQNWTKMTLEIKNNL